MAIQIIRNENGNCINFRGSSAPVYYNACLSGEVDASDDTLVNVVNDIATNSSPDTVYVFYQIPYTEWRDADDNSFASAQDVADYIDLVGNVAVGTDVAAGYQGVWDASTNTPDVSGLTPENGDWFYVSVAGNNDPNVGATSSSSSGSTNTYNINDIIKYDENSGTWQLIKNETVRVDQLQQEVSEIVHTTTSVLENTNTSIYADADPGTLDPNGTAGWYYKNLDANIGKINWYYVGNLNPENQMTFGTMKSMYVVIDVVAEAGVPYFSLYSQRENDGNDVSWYRSRKTFFANQLLDGRSGQQVLLYWGEDPSDLHTTIPHIELPLDESTSVGPQSNDENILFGALSTSSGEPEGTYEFIAKSLGYKNNTHIREYVLDSETTSPAQPDTTEVSSSLAIDFSKDATNTSIILSHDGSSYGVNTIKATDAGDGTITLSRIGNNGEELITNINWENVTVAGGSAGSTLAGVVNALNSLITVNPLGGGGDTATILPTLDGVDVTYTLQEGNTPVTGTPTHLYTTGSDTSSGHGARLWSTETIDAAGEYFDVKITGEGRFILGLADTGSNDLTELANDSGNGHSGLFWSQAFYDYGSYIAPWTNYGSSASSVPGPGWTPTTTEMMRYNTQIQTDFENMDEVLFRVGIDESGYMYVSYYDAGRSNTFIRCSRRSNSTPAGNYALVVKLWSGNTTLVEVPERVATDPDAPTLSYRYIESPDGSFHYPLFATEEEANHVDTENGGSGTSHTHVYVDDPSNTAWYMPDTGGQMAVSSAPSNTADVIYTEIPTNADEQHVPTQYSYSQTVAENTSVNIQVTPQGASWTTTVSGLPDGLTFNGYDLIQGVTPYVPEDTSYAISVVRTNAFGSSTGTLNLTIQDNASLGDFTSFTEVSGNLVQPNRMILDFDALVQYDTVLSQGQELTYSFSSGSIPPTIGILSTTGQARVDDFDPNTHTLGSGNHDFAETDKWDLRFVTFGGYVGGTSTKFNLVGWSDNTTIAGSEGTNVDVEFKLEYANDGYIRLYRNGVLLKTSDSTFTGDQTLTLASFDDQAQTDVYIPNNFTITTTGAGTTTPPTGFADPLLEGEMGSTTLLGNPDDSVQDAVAQLTEQLKVNHRFVFPQTWVEANILPYVQADDTDVYVGVPEPSVSWTDVGTGDFSAMFKIEGTANTSHRSKIKVDPLDDDSFTVNSLTDAFYDYALEWDGEDLHVIACNIGDINTQPGISDGGVFSRVMTYSGYGTATGTTGQPLDIVIGVDNGGQVNLTTSGLQQIRIPFGSRTILVGENSAGDGQFGQVSSSEYDATGQHAPSTLIFNAPTVNAGYTYTFVYDPSMESGDYIEFRLASDNTTVYTTGVTAFDNTTDGNPDETSRYKGITFAVPSDAPPLKIYYYNSYQSGSFDTGRELPISGSTYVVPVTDITLEGPAANQTGTNVMDANDHGWISLDDQLSAGERLVLDNAFFTDFLAEVVDTNTIFAIGIKGDNWVNTKEVNNATAANTGEFFKGDTYLVGVSNSLGTGVEFRIVSGSTQSNTMTISSNLFSTMCAFIDITSTGNNIRMGFGRNGNLSVTQGDESSVAYADWSSYKAQTGDQGYGITSKDVVMSFWTFDGGDIDGAEVDWTGLSEISVPQPAATLTTPWTKALDFSGSSERAQMVSTSSSHNPMMMGNVAATVSAHTSFTDGSYTSDRADSRPWACAVVFSSDNNASNQHIWNVGEGAGSTDDNIYLRVDSSRNLYFGWGRSGALNECTLGTLASGSGNWYGIYVASTGQRLSGSDANSTNLAKCFDIRGVNLSTGSVGSNIAATTSNWTTTGGRMDRNVSGATTIGGRGSNRNFHGKVASWVVTTLKVGVTMPTDEEISMMVRDPQQWLTDYKVGDQYRLPQGTSNFGPFVLNASGPAYGTQVWLMGDGIYDGYAQIRNNVYPAIQNVYPLNMISMVSNDIQTVSIPGLS